MSANLQETASRHELVAVLPDRFALRWHHAIICGAFVLMFLWFSYIPVASTKTWNSVVNGSFGERIGELIPFSSGIRRIAVGETADAMISALYVWSGPELLSAMHAVTQIFIVLLWASVFYRFTMTWSAVVWALAISVVCLPWTTGLNSQTFGQIALAVLAWLLCSETKTHALIRWSDASATKWIAVFALFALWANLDASVVIGMTWLGALTLSRFFEVASLRHWKTVCADRELQCRLWLFEFSGIATLLTTHHVKLWEAMFWWPDNPFWSRLAGWHPTTIASLTGIAIVISTTVWLVFRIKQDTSADMFWTATQIAAFAFVAVSEPMILWMAPLMVLSIVAVRENTPSVSPQFSGVEHGERPLRFTFTLVTALLLWIGFSFSPWASYLIGGKTRSEAQIVGPQMPFAARDHLVHQTPDGVLHCPLHWADWLQANLGIPLMVNSETTALPPTVVEDHRQIAAGEENWQRIAEKYALKSLLIDKQTQQELVWRIRRTPGSWKIVYEDSQAILIRNDA